MKRRVMNFIQTVLGLILVVELTFILAAPLMLLILEATAKYDSALIFILGSAMLQIGFGVFGGVFMIKYTVFFRKRHSVG